MPAIAPSFLPLLATFSPDAAAMERQISGDWAVAVSARYADPAEKGSVASGHEPVAEPVPPPPAGEETDEIDADESLIDGRKRPGQLRRLPDRVIQENPGAIRPPPPSAFPTDSFPVPDRWRLIESLGLVKERWFDPYNQNTYKGDRPICTHIGHAEEAGHAPKAEDGDGQPGENAHGDDGHGEADAHGSGHARGPDPVDPSKTNEDFVCKTPKFLKLKGDHWFFVVNAISDTIIEQRSFPIPVGVQTTERPDSNDVFGRNDSLVLAQTFIVGAALIKGSTAYMPPEVEYRLTLAYNINHVDVPERRVLFVQPSKGSNRTDDFLGVQELFIDYHLRNTSDRYDFESIRVGIQPFQADFRGFLFQDNQLGFRFFGNRDNNRFQFNLAAFWRLEKDTNSGLNDVTQRPRNDFVFFANLYRQDFPLTGFTSQISATYNLNREANRLEIDDNGFPVRPALLGDLRGREYDVVYLGYAGDGRIGRINLTTSLYAALGEDRNSFFTSKQAKIRAGFAAAEASYDANWMRFRLSGLYATGDKDPYNNVEGGFDAIFENPIFAGADTSYWIRQTIPFAGGGRVIGIQGRNGVLNSLRSSKEQGQSNFNNPGTVLVGAGTDFDLTPEFRISTNVNHLWFANTNLLEALRTEGTIPKGIGWDISAAAIWRPKATQNIVFRLSGAMLEPSKGFKDLFANSGRDRGYYSILFNGILAF